MRNLEDIGTLSSPLNWNTNAWTKISAKVGESISICHIVITEVISYAILYSNLIGKIDRVKIRFCAIMVMYSKYGSKNEYQRGNGI